MRGGDLSNEPARGIGFRFEGVLKAEQKLNKAAKAYLESVGSLNVNRIIITLEEARKAMAFCYKWSIPYYKVIQVESEFEIVEVCNEHKLLYYYDADRSVVENVNIRSRGVKAVQWTVFES